MILKMYEDKELVITKTGNTYQDENNAETIKMYLPKLINGVDIGECSVWFSFLTPSTGDAVEIKDISAYSDDYYVASLPMHQIFTEVVGNINMWINVVNKDKDFYLTTNPVSYTVKEKCVIDGETPVPDAPPVGSALERLKDVENAVIDIETRVENIAKGDEQIIQPMFIGKIEK